MKRKKEDSRSINLVLLAVSFIIFGVLGIVFITQMELHPGWAWEEYRDLYPMEIYTLETEDLNGNGVNEIIGYADIRGTDEPERYETIQYGGIYCLEGANGKLIWSRNFNGPVKKLFPIMDVDGDGIRDYFISRAAISPNWTYQDGNAQPEILRNQYTNQIINGSEGSDISIPVGDGLNFTNYYVHDLISLDNLHDTQEDLILLECEGYEVFWDNQSWTDYNCSINSYFINGTMKSTINNVYNGSINPDGTLPALETIEYKDQPQMLYIQPNSLALFNLSINNFLDEIYNIPFPEWIKGYAIIKDLNRDNISEILVTSWNGNVLILNGSNGVIVGSFAIPSDPSEIEIKEIPNFEENSSTYVLFNIRYWYSEDNQEKIMRVYHFDLLSEEIIWEKIKQSSSHIQEKVFILNEDLNGDLVDELIYSEEYKPLVSFSEVRRYTIFNPINGKEFATLNTEYHANSIITVSDFDGDGKKDFAISGDGRIIALSTSKPVGLWLSPIFPLGLPLFIILVILSVAGTIIVILMGKRLSYKRQAIKEHKLTVVVNALAIALMTITFLLFLILMNIFNNTLITGTNNTNIVVAFLIVTITWYGVLPLTAALYNQFAPYFAYIFVKLRSLFFRISKGYKSEIFIVDMGEKKEIGLIIQLKRLILPLLLSISVGFYSYDVLTGLLGYPQTFNVFGSTEFFSFMMGYMLCCVLPMILSFVIFAFFISGNYLLDDAGIVYYRENKKYRQPADIEPISIWAQSIVKGIAGLSALLTFGAFISSVDFSGFFEDGNFMMAIFGVLLTLVMFVGIPFLTASSYILLAGEIMELNADENIQKLYNIMENNGYDTKPRNITNIYRSGSIIIEKNNNEIPNNIE